ncbi:SurA N-terminal domain-containing protein [Desulfobulbus rhabdoformis]|jgi:peptidyl-prolyl cis-trans isomerase SurA|nr:SurA N-terminal domain-containing protein [Desulfobulbus rhabdoformis]
MILSLLVSLTEASAQIVDRSVAIVNNDTITLSEVNELGASFFKKVTEDSSPERLNEALYRARLTVIDKLIEKRLMIQEAQKLQIQVSDQDVEGALQRILSNNHTTLEQFRKELKTMGMSEKQYREELRDQILSSRLVNYEVRTKVVIPEEKILDYYDTHFVEQSAGGYYLRQIGCLWGRQVANGSTPTKDQARKKVQKVYDLAQEGKDFKTLARTYSDLANAEDGGDLGLFQLNELAPYIRDNVSQLKAGEISPIVATENSYLFFQVVSTEKGKIIPKAPYAEVKDQIKEKLSQQAMERRFKEWMQSIREKAYIKIL